MDLLGGLLRILQVIPYLNPRKGGDVRVCYNLSKSLVSSGHQVTIVTTDQGFDQGYTEGLRNMGIEVIPFRCLLDLESYLISPAIKAWASRRLWDYDIVHLHGYRSYQNRTIAPIAKKQGIPFVIHAHGGVPIAVEKKLLKRGFDFMYGRSILRGASALIAFSQEEAKNYVEVGANPLDVKVIYNGFDPDEYSGICEGQAFKDAYRIEKPYCLFLGRIDETKGLEFLLKGFSRFLEKGNHGVILVMVGPKGNSWRKTMRLIAELELNDSTKWIDFLDNSAKMEAYAGAELFVTTPNYRSGAVLTMVEALLCGTPIIVTDEIGEIPRLAGIDECVIRYGDIEGFAQLMERMLSDKEWSRQIACKGRKYITENLKWSDVTKRLADVYENCIRNP